MNKMILWGMWVLVALFGWLWWSRRQANRRRPR